MLSETVDELAAKELAGEVAELGIDPGWQSLLDLRERFWTKFLSELVLHDPEQLIPKPPRQGYVKFYLPVPGGSVWLPPGALMSSG